MKNIKILISCVMFLLLLIPSIPNLTSAANYSDSSITIWSASNTEKIEKHATIRNTDASLKYEMAANEHEGSQIILTPAQRINSYNVTVSDLINRNDNSKIISSNNISTYVQHYVNVTTPSSNGLVAGFYPDALIPIQSIVNAKENFIEANTNQGLWFTLKTPKGIIGGVYQGKATISLDSKIYIVPITVRVFNFELDDKNNKKSAFLIWTLPMNQEMLSYGEGLGLNTNGDANLSEELLKNYYDFLSDYRVNPTYLPTYSYMAYQTSVPAGYSYMATKQKFLDVVTEYTLNPKTASFDLPVFFNGEVLDESKLNALLTDLISGSLSQNINLLEKAYFYIPQIDEPNYNGLMNKVIACNLAIYNIKQALANSLALFPNSASSTGLAKKVRDSLLGLKNIVTTPYASSLDIPQQSGGNTGWCPMVNYYENNLSTYYNMRNSSGDALWWYTCILPKKPYSTYFVDDNLISGRVLGIMQYKNKIEGELYWSVNNWKKNVTGSYVDRDIWTDPVSFQDVNGDGMIIYPGEKYGIDGPIGTVRLEGIRDGAEDYEYLLRLEQELAIANGNYGTAYNTDTYLQSAYSKLFNGMKPNSNTADFINTKREIASLIEGLISPSKTIVESVPVSISQADITVYAQSGSVITINGTLASTIAVYGGVKATKRSGMNSNNEILVEITLNGDTTRVVRYPYSSATEIKPINLIASATRTIRDGMLLSVTTNTSVNTLINSLSSTNATGTIKAFDKNNQLLASSDKVGTGTQLKLFEYSSFGIVDDLKIIVYGDINGDGILNSMDLSLLNDYINNNSQLSKYQIFASDVNKSGSVDIADYNIISNSISSSMALTIRESNNNQILFTDLQEDTTHFEVSTGSISLNSSNNYYGENTGSIKLSSYSSSVVTVNNCILYDDINMNFIKFFVFNNGTSKAVLTAYGKTTQLEKNKWSIVQIEIADILAYMNSAGFTGFDYQISNSDLSPIEVYFDDFYVSANPVFIKSVYDDISSVPPLANAVSKRYVPYSLLDPAYIVNGNNSAHTKICYSKTINSSSTTKTLKLMGDSWADFDFVNISKLEIKDSKIFFNVYNPNSDNISLYIFGKNWIKYNNSDIIFTLPRKSWTKIEIPSYDIFTEIIKLAFVGNFPDGMYMDNIYFDEQTKNTDVAEYNSFNNISSVSRGNWAGTEIYSFDTTTKYLSESKSLRLSGNDKACFKIQLDNPVIVTTDVMKYSSISFMAFNSYSQDITLKIFGQKYYSPGSQVVTAILQRNTWCKVVIPITSATYNSEFSISLTGNSGTGAVNLSRIELSNIVSGVYNNFDNALSPLSPTILMDGWKPNEAVAVDTSIKFSGSDKSIKLSGDSWSCFNIKKDSTANSNNYSTISFMVYNSYDIDIILYLYGNSFLKPDNIDVKAILPKHAWTKVTTRNYPNVYNGELHLSISNSSGNGAIYLDTIYYEDITSSNFNSFDNALNQASPTVVKAGWNAGEAVAIDTSIKYHNSDKSLRISGSDWSCFTIKSDTFANRTDYSQISFMAYSTFNQDILIYLYGKSFLKYNGEEVIFTLKKGAWTKITVPNYLDIYNGEMSIALVNSYGAGSVYLDKIKYSNEFNDYYTSNDTKILYGDLDSSGTCNLVDFTLIKRHILRLDILRGESFAAGDFNQNNKITMSNLLAIKKFLLNL